MKTIAFHTLGCKLNFSESSAMAARFEDRGFKRVEFEEEADIYVINTCSVTENADKKCRQTVKAALGRSPHAFIAVVGCYAQLKPKEIAEIPGVDAVLGAADKFRLPELFETFEKVPHTVLFTGDIDEVKDYHSAYSLNDRTRTFLKVQDGCDYSCTFCTIPLARGSSRSDTVANVVKLAGDIAATGVKEIVLTGVNIGDFGIVNGVRRERFIDLVKALDGVEGIDRFRISSIEPNLLSDEVIQTVAGSGKFVPHFHIPLQSGSDKVLKLMKRRYLSPLYRERVAAIKSLMPDCCIGVDVIVGFPGESDEDFETTRLFLADLDISYLHVFTYSERTNTPAAEMENPVPAPVRAERSQILRELSERKRLDFYRKNLGSVRPVLFEEKNENGFMSGFSDNYVKVTVPYNPDWVNTVKQMSLDSITDRGTVAGFFVGEHSAVIG